MEKRENLLMFFIKIEVRRKRWYKEDRFPFNLGIISLFKNILNQPSLNSHWAEMKKKVYKVLTYFYDNCPFLESNQPVLSLYVYLVDGPESLFLTHLSSVISH